jgi:hypothetical protein
MPFSFRKLNDVLKGSAQPEPSIVATTPSPIPVALQRRVTKKQNEQTPRASNSRRYPVSQSQTADQNIITSLRSEPHPPSLPTSYHATRFHVQSDMIRQLRKQIQARYALDMQIWNKGRNMKTFARGPLKDKMRRSDAMLREIRNMLHDWDNREYFEDQATYETFCDIKRRMDATGKRDWERHPPWQGHGGNSGYVGWESNRYA